jgi:xanthine dehydrogenase iron-sulfur cluster and FAD-binding subunit A
MAGNPCRCTGYQNIVKAVQYAAADGGEARLITAQPRSSADTRARRARREWVSRGSARKTALHRARQLSTHRAQADVHPCVKATTAGTVLAPPC